MSSGLPSFFRPVVAAALLIAAALFVCGPATLSAQDASASRAAATKARVARYLDGRRAVGAARLLDLAKREQAAMLVQPRASTLSAPWVAVGPAQVATALYGKVTGRVTAVAIDPADATGNTVYLGTTGGGVWKSTNAAGDAASVQFVPVTDTLPVYSANAGSSVIPSLSLGAVAVGGGVVLAGTGDANDATDSYYGAGILRSADGGTTWSLIQVSNDGAAGTHTFFGLGFAGFAISTANPQVMVAAASESAEGLLVNAPFASTRVLGLYFSNDAGVTWHLSTIEDGSQIVQGPGAANTNGGNAATSVVWNALRQRFYAAVRYHGYYQSADGVTWTRLTQQPGAGLSTTACAANPAVAPNTACPIFRGALAVQPVTGDVFALTTDSTNKDQGLYQDVCAANGAACGNAAVTFGVKLNASPLEAGSGSTVIAQADYNLVLAAAAVGGDTALYAGTVDVYRCTLAGGCALRNTTDAENGCLHPAGVAPSQHALAASGTLLFTGNDGGLWRSIDGVAQTGAACSVSDASHYQNLNGALGSLAEVVSFAQDPVAAGTLLTGLGALGTSGTSSASGAWPQLATGEGGMVAIDPAAPANWYLSLGAGMAVGYCGLGSGCAAGGFTATVGEAQVSNDATAIHAAWMLDPDVSTNLIAGTCRAWRGPAQQGAAWSSANEISRPFSGGSAGCPATQPVARTLGAGGAQAQGGASVLYAGLAGSLDGGQGFGGHVFVTTATNGANGTTAWTDRSSGFNVGGFDVSSLAVDAHDATGATVYATVMGFTGNGINAPRVYRSVDAGGHWADVSANLPNAPANSIVVDPNDANTLYVATDAGVYVTTEITGCTSSNCWSLFGSGLPNAPAIQLAAAAAMPTGDGRLGMLRVGTYGRGIWQVPLLTAVSPAAPQIQLSPVAVTYPAQPVGTTSPPVTVMVTNTGNAALTVTSVVAAGDFVESTTCVGTPVQQGASCAVQVSFAPTALGARTGLLTVYGNVAGGQATATLSGVGTAPAAIVLTPGALTFATTSVGATSAAQIVTIANTGGTPSFLSGETIAGDYGINASTCGSMLAAQTACSISIVFMPTVSGTRGGTLTVVDDAGTQTANLNGIATSPATDALSPLSLTFAGQQVNTISATQNVTLANAGDVPLTLIAGTITSGDFTVANGCGNSLVAHASCALTVAYVPKDVGVRTGVLTVSDQFRSQQVTLNGIGLAPPGVSLSPVGGLAFGAVGIGSSAQYQTVTLSNNGGVALAIGGVAATGDFSILAGSNTCTNMLAPAAACLLQIGFVPTLGGVRTGTVTFTDNAANSPQSLSLTGTGVDFALTPDGATSMTIASGTTATYGLLLSSAPGVPGTAAFTCAGAPVHAKCTVNPASASLGATSLVTVTIATGLQTGALEPPRMPWSKPLVWCALLLPMSLLLRKRYKGAGLAAIMLLAAAGCGSGRLIPDTGIPTPTAPIVTPSGSYTIVVAGSSAGLVRSVNLTLNVQ